MNLVSRQFYLQCPFINYFFHSLVVGDKNGNLHLIDANKMEEIKVLHNLHSNKITSIDAGMGGIVTSSSDKTLKILQPDLSLKVIASIEDKELGDVVSVSFSEDCLAAGSGGDIIQVWRPRLDDNSNSVMDVSENATTTEEVTTNPVENS